MTPKLNTSLLPEDKIESPSVTVKGLDAEMISVDVTSPEVPHPKVDVNLNPSHALCFQSMSI